MTAITFTQQGLPPLQALLCPNLTQGVQRYPAVFVAASGPLSGGHRAGVQAYQEGRSGVAGQVLRG